MSEELKDELSFLNDNTAAEKTNSELKKEKLQMGTNNYNNQSEATNGSMNSKIENYLEKENVLRLIIEKWKVDANAGTESGKKSVIDKEDVLKAIIYNWQV